MWVFNSISLSLVSKLALSNTTLLKIDSSMFRGLNHWNKSNPSANTLLIYGGEMADEIKPKQNILPWNQINLF
jgi:hypothetical protein